MVGWVSARVVLLAARPRRCFRCFDTGHVAAKCQHPEDRSRRCFRCGTSGHKAAECEAAPNCFVCEAAGKTERAHVLGASGCVARPSLPGTTAESRRAPRKARTKKPKANGGGGAVPAPPAMELDA
ncbi:DNA-binding protein HEXBP-like [Danaus plexippus]|uniref:DNA-binding protein HEXBP-like n=1 Tax=Danaus plexippus TaxID=13037 RepID=UPI002AB2FBA9|nr:DNA-binding protein HEXBP-like [Danaus plexippus]XP_061385237.1 DNA-binding protein HEXBP-like [Danaus plexippus]